MSAVSIKQLGTFDPLACFFLLHSDSHTQIQLAATAKTEMAEIDSLSWWIREERRHRMDK